MEKFKVGDRVRIREWDDMKGEFGLDRDGDIASPMSFTGQMRHLCGRAVEIEAMAREIVILKNCNSNNSTLDWYFTADMIEPVKKRTLISTFVDLLKILKLRFS